MSPTTTRVGHKARTAVYSALRGMLTPVPDAPLTELGKKQAKQLNEYTKDNIQRKAELLVTSPVSLSRWTPSHLTAAAQISSADQWKL